MNRNLRVPPTDDFCLKVSSTFGKKSNSFTLLNFDPLYLKNLIFSFSISYISKYCTKILQFMYIKLFSTVSGLLLIRIILKITEMFRMVAKSL